VTLVQQVTVTVGAGSVLHAARFIRCRMVLLPNAVNVTVTDCDFQSCEFEGPWPAEMFDQRPELEPEVAAMIARATAPKAAPSLFQRLVRALRP